MDCSQGLSVKQICDWYKANTVIGVPTVRRPWDTDDAQWFKYQAGEGRKIHLVNRVLSVFLSNMASIGVKDITEERV